MSKNLSKLILLIIIFSLSSCREKVSNKREEFAILDKIVEEHSQIMFEKYGFIKTGNCTYHKDGDVSAVSVDMKILGPKSISFARKMVLETAKDLLQRLLEKPILKQFFVDKNIDYKNINYAIFFKNKKNDLWVCHDLRDWENQLNMVRLRDGEILYMAEGIEFDSGNSLIEKIETLDNLENE